MEPTESVPPDEIVLDYRVTYLDPANCTIADLASVFRCSDPDCECHLPQEAAADDELDLAPQQPFRRSGPKLGPNAPCPCGSGKKLKKCCRDQG